MTEVRAVQVEPEQNDRDHQNRSAQYVTFLVGKKIFGIVIVMVREIKQWTQTTSLPNQNPHMRGVLNLRGTIVPVHDLRARFGGPLTEATENHVVVIATVGDQTIGILVDAVSDIVSVSDEDIRPVPKTGELINDNCISGLVSNGEEMVALLNLEGMFGQGAQSEDLQRFEQA